MGMSLLHTGEIAESREHFDRRSRFMIPPSIVALAARFG